MWVYVLTQGAFIEGAYDSPATAAAFIASGLFGEYAQMSDNVWVSETGGILRLRAFELQTQGTPRESKPGQVE